jgi:L-gulonolactone oxidase
MPPHQSDGIYVSMQYGVPASTLEIAIDSIKRSGFPSLHPGRVMELKYLKKDPGSYLGPNSDDEAVLFNLYWQTREASRLTIFEPFETTMRALGARPHWGKLHTVPDAEYLQLVYPGWKNFETVRRRLDPHETFSMWQTQETDSK